jgi:Protein of unknown function (DUF1552)
MKHKPLSRRFVLRGTAGVTVALPLLESMGSTSARAAPVDPPKRYLLGYAGTSLGGSDGSIADTFVPTATGANYDLKSALAALAPVKNEVTVVTGMKIPWGDTPPLGGKVPAFHYHSMQPLLTGMRGDFSTPTSEHLVSGLVGNATFNPLLLRVQASIYINGAPLGSGTALSYRAKGAGVEAVAPRASPQGTFTALFSALAGTGLTPEQVAQKNWELKNRKSILDGVKERYLKLSQRVSSADKRRLDDHLQEVRDLEVRVSAIPPAQTAICFKPMDPGADPTLGGDTPILANGNTGYAQNVGYSNEDLRAKVMCDLLYMAYACDLTRSSMLQFTNVQSFMNMFEITGQKSNLHELSHGSFGNQTEANDTAAMAKGINWHMKHWASLIQKLATTKEGPTSILDNMAACFVFEGGQGFVAEDNSPKGAHSTENMAALVSGGLGNLKRGIHLKAPNAHPAQVILTAMRALGHTGNLGEMTSEIAGLRGP